MISTCNKNGIKCISIKLIKSQALPPPKNKDNNKKNNNNVTWKDSHSVKNKYNKESIIILNHQIISCFLNYLILIPEKKITQKPTILKIEKSILIVITPLKDKLKE
jgi:hypothetical protein